MTLELLKHQPDELHGAIMDALRKQVVELSVMMHFEFADEPLRLCNRTVGFTDLNGQLWQKGGGLVVGMPNLSGGQGQLAPLREYHLGVFEALVERANWRAELVEMISDKPNYRRRDYGLYGQLMTDGAPLGLPIAWDVGVMDRMSARFTPKASLVTLGCEGPMARKGVPAYGMQTYFDQIRRFPTDKGMQFTTENGRLIVWTDW
ncbi:hypothetical protein [Shimia sp. MIT910701]|uniref:hypothetical protein n=1 Tax=Shimia sp. MIT910701 TaxID=3096987 RepID=UPI00399A815B